MIIIIIHFKVEFPTFTNMNKNTFQKSWRQIWSFIYVLNARMHEIT